MYDLTLQIFELTQHFSREYKFTLGQDMKQDAIQLVRCIYRANKAKQKEGYLEEFLDHFEVLKLETRLCKDLHLITIKQQARLALAMETIGRQITLVSGNKTFAQHPVIPRLETGPSGFAEPFVERQVLLSMRLTVPGEQEILSPALQFSLWRLLLSARMMRSDHQPR
jgi:hypothetical protein